MLKTIMWLSAVMQLLVSVIANEHGQVLDDPKPNETNSTTTETVDPPSAPPKAPTKNELLREISETHGFNAFDPNEVKEKLKAYDEWQESQKTEQEKLQEQVQAYEATVAQKEQTILEYQSKFKAIELGIATDKVDDALKLAGNDPNQLAEVVKKYPMFVSGGNNNPAITIGVNNPNNNNAPSEMSEQERYMAENYANNPYYKKK